MNCKATSIGRRSQSAKTILEKYVEQFDKMNMVDFVKVGVEAIKNTLEKEEEVSPDTVDIWVIDNEGIVQLTTEKLKEIFDTFNQ